MKWREGWRASAATATLFGLRAAMMHLTRICIESRETVRWVGIPPALETVSSQWLVDSSHATSGTAIHFDRHSRDDRRQSPFQSHHLIASDHGNPMMVAIRPWHSPPPTQLTIPLPPSLQNQNNKIHHQHHKRFKPKPKQNNTTCIKPKRISRAITKKEKKKKRKENDDHGWMNKIK